MITRARYLLRSYLVKYFGGEVFWGKPSDCKPEDTTPGFFEITRLVEAAPRPFFSEITVTLPA
jgi:hypothetical protein